MLIAALQIGMRAVPTDHTAKRLLVGPVGSVYIMAHTALLGGIGAPDSDGGYASFGGIPGYLLGDVRQVGGVQIRIHGTRLELHRGDRQVFIGELVALVLGKALVNRAVDLLAHVPGETLSCCGCSWREAF